MLKSISLQFKLLLCLAFLVFPASTSAQTNPYPVNSRSVFLAGCLLENSPNFQNDSEVVNVMRICVCILDKFQANYTNQAFMTLYANAERDAKAKQELETFVQRQMPNCL